MDIEFYQFCWSPNFSKHGQKLVLSDALAVQSQGVRMSRFLRFQESRLFWDLKKCFGISKMLMDFKKGFGT